MGIGYTSQKLTEAVGALALSKGLLPQRLRWPVAPSGLLQVKGNDVFPDDELRQRWRAWHDEVVSAINGDSLRMRHDRALRLARELLELQGEVERAYGAAFAKGAPI